MADKPLSFDLWQTAVADIARLRVQATMGFIRAVYGPKGRHGGLNDEQIGKIEEFLTKPARQRPQLDAASDFAMEQFRELSINFSRNLMTRHGEGEARQYAAFHYLVGSTLVGSLGYEQAPNIDLPRAPVTKFFQDWTGDKPPVDEAKPIPRSMLRKIRVPRKEKRNG